MNYVIGAEQIVMNLNRARILWLGKIADAVEKSLVDGANHAKAGHIATVAHANQRYRNITSNLTKNTFTQMTKISVNRVTGEIYNTMEYAPAVEFGSSKTWFAYPFLFPALVHIQPILRARLELAIRGL